MLTGNFENREAAHAGLLTHGFCDDDAEYILDMIDMANSRFLPDQSK